jgi:BASS family bile acid:Na+ symporter
MTLSNLETTLLPVFMIFLMLGLGATLSPDSFRQILQRPKPVLIGLACQFGWMPLIALALALALDLPQAIAVGLIIMSCCSGGPISNFFSYISRADLALSICMTVVSTVVGVFLIPVLLFIYTAPFIGISGDDHLVIPYGKIIVTLIAILVPVGLGVFIRGRSPLWASRIETGGAISGWTIIVLLLISSLLREGSALLQLEPLFLVAGLLLAPIGFTLGYFSAKSAGLATNQRRAVALETGIQNVPLGLGIIVISFAGEVRHDIMVLPLLYSVTIVPLSAFTVWLFRCQGMDNKSDSI